MDMPGIGQIPEGSGEQKKKMEETGCEIILDVPRTPRSEEICEGEEVSQQHGLSQRVLLWCQKGA